MMISHHSSLSPLPNLHFHLPRRILLKQAKSLIPKPPLFLLLNIVSHVIQANFFSSYPNPRETVSLTLFLQCSNMVANEFSSSFPIKVNITKLITIKIINHNNLINYILLAIIFSNKDIFIILLIKIN